MATQAPPHFFISFFFEFFFGVSGAVLWFGAGDVLVAVAGVSGSGADLPIAVITLVQNAFSVFHMAYNCTCFSVREEFSLAQVIRD